MAKEMTAQDVLAFLEERGMVVPTELVDTIANEKEDNAFHVIASLLDLPESSDKGATEVATYLQVALFDLAGNIYDHMTHEVNNVGQGKKDQTKFTVETNHGTLFVRLTRP